MKAVPAPPEQAVESLRRILAKRTGQPIPIEREALRLWLEARPADWAWVVATRPHFAIPAGIVDRSVPGVIDKIRSANLPLDPRSHHYWRLMARLEKVGPDEARRYLADTPDHLAALLELLEADEAG